MRLSELLGDEHRIASKVGIKRLMRRMSGRIMTVAELSDYFGIPKERVNQMLTREVGAGFPGFRVGGEWRVDLEQMREWMCERIEEKASVIPAGVSHRTRHK